MGFGDEGPGIMSSRVVGLRFTIRIDWSRLSGRALKGTRV